MKIVSRSAALATLPLLLAAGPVLAQTKASEPETQEIDCLAYAKVWRGAGDEIRDIETTPVPDSYKKEAAQTGCEGWSFVRESLIFWHFRYGSEHSASLAMDYFEASERHPGTRTPAFARVLARALAGFGTGSLPADPAPTAKLRRLQALIQEWKDAVRWGGERLRAAEFFNAPALRAKADDDLTLALAGYLVLAKASADSSVKHQGDLIERLGIEKDSFAALPEMQTRMAILKARLSGDPADITAASGLVDKEYRKTFSAALDRAEDNGYMLCKPDPDAPANDPRFAEINALCADDEDRFKRQATRFWVKRAEVDLLMASDPAHFALVKDRDDHAGSLYAPIAKDSVATAEQPGRFTVFDRAKSAIRLVANQNPDLRWPTLRDRSFPFAITIDEQIDLSLRVAEARLKLGDGFRSGRISKDAPIPAEVGRYPADAAWSATEQWSEGMQELVPASLLILPTEYPSRFRQIARLYQSLFERTVRLSGDDRGFFFDQETRAAKYFSSTLAALDGNAAVDTSPNEIRPKR